MTTKSIVVKKRFKKHPFFLVQHSNKLSICVFRLYQGLEWIANSIKKRWSWRNLLDGQNFSMTTLTVHMQLWLFDWIAGRSHPRMSLVVSTIQCSVVYFFRLMREKGPTFFSLFIQVCCFTILLCRSAVEGLQWTVLKTPEIVPSLSLISYSIKGARNCQYRLKNRL